MKKLTGLLSLAVISQIFLASAAVAQEKANTMVFNKTALCVSERSVCDEFGAKPLGGEQYFEIARNRNASTGALIAIRKIYLNEADNKCGDFITFVKNSDIWSAASSMRYCANEGRSQISKFEIAQYFQRSLEISLKTSPFYQEGENQSSSASLNDVFHPQVEYLSTIDLKFY